MQYQIHHGDCREVMQTLHSESVDSIVSDPPYGLSFMGKGWDHGVPGVEFWVEALRVAKPGAHLLAFGGTRTYHRLACAIEDAGWEIRDCVMWVYGSGFPKSHDVSKAIDKAAGAEREVVGSKLGQPGYSLTDGKGGLYGGGFGANGTGDGECRITAPATDAARQWQGWGTALKPAWEPIIVARKPLCGTVADNVLRHGTGAINVDGCRVGTEVLTYIAGETGGDSGKYGMRKRASQPTTVTGRWPANVIHDGSDEVVGLFPDRDGGAFPATQNTASWKMSSKGKGLSPARAMADSGSAARFFYCAKASKADRDEGCEGLDASGRIRTTGRGLGNSLARCPVHDASLPSGSMTYACGCKQVYGDDVERRVERHNTHPTVKPTALMRYLCRLVTPPGGVVLDPFTGSGSTGKAAILEGFRFIGIEREAEYVEIARARIAAAAAKSAQPSLPF